MGSKMYPVMVDMAMTQEEKTDCMPAVECAPAKCDEPRYPWGLCISLSEKELAKLKVSPDAFQVGGMVHLHCMTKVTSMSANEHADGMSCRVELQITSMAMESEDAENQEQEEAEDVKPARRINLSRMYKD